MRNFTVLYGNCIPNSKEIGNLDSEKNLEKLSTIMLDATINFRSCFSPMVSKLRAAFFILKNAREEKWWLH